MKAEITAYLENLPADRQATLLALRQEILNSLDQVEETFQYRMPNYTVDGKTIASLASQKNYISLYLDVEALDAHRGQFEHQNCGKSCVRFRKLSDLPLDAIKSILIQTVALNQSRV